MSQNKPVPSGISFGNKVLVVPGIASQFTHSGEINSVLETGTYTWISRGDAIAEFFIDGSYSSGFLSRTFSNQRHVVEIRSPVSGLVLHATLDDEHSLAKWSSLKQPPLAKFAILLPDDEPQPENASFIFGSTCALIQDMKHYYLKQSRRWSMGPFTEQRLDELISLQRSVSPLIFDALPFWRDYLDEARTKRPELRPLLKHLL